jgi:hypothetical protein
MEAEFRIAMKTGKPEMQPIILSAFGLLGLVAMVPVAYLALAPDPVPVYLGPGQQAAVAAPNHDPNRVALPQPAAVEPEIVAAALPPAIIAPTVPPGVAPASAAVSPPTLESIAQWAGPEPGTPPAPTFVTTDTKLYARDKARLRAAPSMAADVVATLDAEAPLRASARSTDGVWWRVPLGDGRLVYVHKTAVTRNLAAKAKPKPVGASTPVAAVAPAQPAPSRRNEGFLGYVDQTVDWFVDTAARGSPPTLTRPER